MGEKLCVYREQGTTVLKTGGEVIFPSRPPLKAVSKRECKILIAKGMSDVTCHNTDMDHLVCPISPQHTQTAEV